MRLNCFRNGPLISCCRQDLTFNGKATAAKSTAMTSRLISGTEPVVPSKTMPAATAPVHTSRLVP